MVSIPSSIRRPDEKRSYAHFDLRVTYKSVAEQVADPRFIKRYAFYPLIERDLVCIKSEGKGRFRNKPRTIRYAAHMDRCIYQHYAYLLNELYNSAALKLGVDDCSIAYRNNKRGKSNCDFALKAFSAIRSMGDCYVYAGDFASFFDTLDHATLKRQVRLLFEDGTIPDDYYHVLKGATRCSVWRIEKLLEYHGLSKTKNGLKRLNGRKRVLEPGVFKSLVKDSVEKPWAVSKAGVPQGLPVSGVLANIYMLSFDSELNDKVCQLGGAYMRYSDDFIIIVPTSEALKTVIGYVATLLASIKPVSLQHEKTKAYHCWTGGVKQLPIGISTLEEELSRQVDYLGFSYDGQNVRLRQRTIGRYYGRMYRRIKGLYKEGKRPSKKRVQSLYVEFSDWGKDPNRNKKVRAGLGKKGSHGNFLTYAERAERAFPNDPISLDVKRHKQKIRQRSKRILRESRSELGGGE